MQLFFMFKMNGRWRSEIFFNILQLQLEPEGVELGSCLSCLSYEKGQLQPQNPHLWHHQTFILVLWDIEPDIGNNDNKKLTLFVLDT